MIIVKLVCEEDSNDIFTWRNDSLTRKMSLTNNPVVWEVHKIWFKNILEDENRLLVMCSHAETKNGKYCKV